MLPDSKISSTMELGRNKLKYIVNFALKPYFKDILKSEETASEWFSISFDKTLNKAVQWCEMDLVSCFWNSAANEFHVHFCNSML